MIFLLLKTVSYFQYILCWYDLLLVFLIQWNCWTVIPSFSLWPRSELNYVWSAFASISIRHIDICSVSKYSTLSFYRHSIKKVLEQFSGRIYTAVQHGLQIICRLTKYFPGKRLSYSCSCALIERSGLSWNVIINMTASTESILIRKSFSNST